MMHMQVNRLLECEGLACPLPVVKTKKALEELNTGEVLEVRATDRGSVADLQSWSKRTGHQYVGLKEQDGVFRHFIRKADPNEAKADVRYPHTISNEEIKRKLLAGEELNIIDVREPAEYAFGRIPGARSIPLGELEARMHELNPGESCIVVCRSGKRSDMACRTLAEGGFSRVWNAEQGMEHWTYEREQD